MTEFSTVSEYNGWSDYPTWCIHLWLTNDSSSFSFWVDAAAESGFDESRLAELIRDSLEEDLPESGILSDVYSWTLAYVNFREIAEAFIESAREQYEFFYESSLHGFDFYMYWDDVEACSSQGDVTEAVEAVLSQEYLQKQFAEIDPDDIRGDLKETGAWDGEELSDDEENLLRLVWIAACDIRERYS